LSLPELQRTFADVSIEEHEHVGLHGLHGTYDDALVWLSNPENRTRPTVVMSMGSSIGNFSRPQAAEFLGRFSKLMTPSDLMIIGLDGCKDPQKVYRAYNDSEGITRRFYENGLVHANGVLGHEAFKPNEWEIVTDFDSVTGRHQAFYSPTQDVTVNGVSLPKGERLVFEEATKYGPEERDQLWRAAGLIQGAELANSSDDYRKWNSEGLWSDLGVNPISLVTSGIAHISIKGSSRELEKRMEKKALGWRYIPALRQFHYEPLLHGSTLYIQFPLVSLCHS
jgi:L-histidine Nalpha-methyltransferase / hercynylcysteine S-oxide synthase